MTLTKAVPILNAAPAPLDGRLADMALVAAAADGTPRTGVLGGGESIVSTTATLHLAVAAAEFVTSKGKADGVSIFTNNGVVNVPVTAAPVSNSRIDVLWVKQNDNTTGDADSLPTFGVTPGVAAASPSKPAIPTGALELATLRIYSGTTATNGGSNVLTNTYQMTAARRGVVPVRNSADLAAWAPEDGARTFRIDNGFTYERVGGVWEAADSPWVDYSPTWAAADGAVSLGNGSLIGRYRYIARRTVAIRIQLTFGTTTNGGEGNYSFTLPAGMTAHGTGEQVGAAKAWTAGSNHWAGICLVSPSATTLVPWFSLTGGDARINPARNALDGGASGTGIPQIGGSYTYSSGHNIVVEIIVELAS